MIQPHSLLRFLAPSLLITGLVGLVAAVNALDQFSQSHALLINRSPSLPHWGIWLEKQARIGKGDIILFTPPASPLLEAHFGSAPQLFGKYVLGVPGERVSHKGPAVLIEGQMVAMRKTRSRSGHRLYAGSEGIIPQSCYYVGSGHKDGLDSRYAAIGFICKDRILGRGRPIL